MVVQNDSYSSRRKKKLINKKFQYRFILATVIGALILLNVLVLITLLAYGNTLFGHISVNQVSLLGVIELLIVFPLMYFSLIRSHKIAGPIFVFERTLRSIGEGDLTIDVRLREGDEFQESAHLFNTCIGTMRGKMTDIQATVKELDAVLDDASPGKETIAALVKQTDWFKV